MAAGRIMPNPADPLAPLREQIAGMAPEQLEAAVAALPAGAVALVEQAAAEVTATTWRRDPVAMGAHLTSTLPVGHPDRIERWRYAALLGEKFRQLVAGESKRQIWNLPARYGKSKIGSQWGPTWAFDADPTAKIILTSYGDTLANENAHAVRDNLRNHRGTLRCELRPDRQRLDRFVTTEGGGLLARGLLSGITGFGARGVVVDDPFKNWQEAHSEAHRKLVWSTYLSVVSLRLDTDDSWVLVVMTRWHENDLSGMLLDAMQQGTGEAWDLVRIPAIAELHDPDSHDPLLRLPDPLGREPGEVIEPQRFSIETVERRRLVLGSYLFAGMEQQRPAPEEGDEIKRAWWRLDEQFPERYDEALTSWDTKLKDSEVGDFVVGQLWGRTGGDLWLVDQLRGQWNQATTKVAIALMQVRHPWVKRHVVEHAGNAPEVMAELRKADPKYELDPAIADQLGMTADERPAVEALIRRGMSGLQGKPAGANKRTRARAESPTVEAGNAHLPALASFTPAFLDELSAFPNGAHDDQVDAWSQAFKHLSQGIGTGTSVPRGTLPTPRPPAGTGGGLVIARPRPGRR